MRFWGWLSAALHALLLLLLILFGLPRPLPEPVEEAISVELINEAPVQEAQGERPAPTPGPPAPTPPAKPAPPPASKPSPPPPPPPPPPAPAPPPVPQQHAQPKPTPPAPPPEPVPAPLPPPPKPQQQAQTPPKPEPPTPAPAKPTPRPIPTPVKPPQVPSQTAGTGQTPPVKKPEVDSQSVLNTLERLQQTARQTEPPRAPAASAPRVAAGGGTPTGTAPLTAGEKGALANRISECWLVDAGGAGIQNIVVALRVDVDAGGIVRNVKPASGVPTDPRAFAVYRAARSALLDPKCNPLPLPRERLKALEDTVFRFNPRELGLR
jgi:hypothetical protein